MLIFDPAAPSRFILLDRPIQMTDFTTKAPLTTDDGKPLLRFSVVSIREQGRPVQITVKAPAPAAQIEPGSQIVFQGLTGVLWERDGRQAVSFRATAVAAAPTASRSGGNQA